MKSPAALQKDETVALWHAINNWKFMIGAMHRVEGVTQEQIDAEKKLLTNAQRALRKVNLLRKAGL